MRREKKTQSKKLVYANRAAFSVILLLVAVIVIGSLLKMLAGQEQSSAIESEGIQYGGTTEIFTGIGRLRIPLNGEPPATLALTVSFPYPKDDIAFVEELASRLVDFRSIIRGYFSVLTLEGLRRLDENEAKAEILDRYNKLLRLGKIDALFFTDFNWY